MSLFFLSPSAAIRIQLGLLDDRMLNKIVLSRKNKSKLSNLFTDRKSVMTQIAVSQNIKNGFEPTCITHISIRHSHTIELRASLGRPGL